MQASYEINESVKSKRINERLIVVEKFENWLECKLHQEGIADWLPKLKKTKTVYDEIKTLHQQLSNFKQKLDKHLSQQTQMGPEAALVSHTSDRVDDFVNELQNVIQNYETHLRAHTGQLPSAVQTKAEKGEISDKWADYRR